ncbi:hypothetical protein GXP67_28685 [Rhodocytophaga rosea]|uniref:DUF4595 domain-containing protein n=1 Tax=Rhodocytophaga rosea TaxID=2704465 RepID=A0A6C0GQJ2_9BACT|nr:hypothetical protein [Rhodocytophaga rosea]QHT70348.1 hypothetical protein GXP67_28685 [Rhodocytophaga rosea]
MKNSITRIGFILYVLFTFMSCEHEQEEIKSVTKISIGFDEAGKTIKEDTTAQIIQLKLSRKATLPGTITLLMPQDFEKVFTTFPEAINGRLPLPIKEGDVSVSFTITPVDNATKDGNNTGTITLGQLPYPFIMGSNKSINITILDDESPASYKESLAGFIPSDVTLPEGNTPWAIYVIQLSEPAAVTSNIQVSVTSAKAIYNTHFISQPAAINGLLNLDVAEGARTVEFKAISLTNTDFTGELAIDFTITGTTGSIRKGENLTQTLKISDDELAQKPKGYEHTAGNTIVKKNIEYDNKGRVAKVYWETYHPAYSTRTDTYFYNGRGELVKINKSTDRDLQYTWQEGRITKSEYVVDGIVRDYTEYEYDTQGNIAGTSTHHREQDGSFTQGFISVYFYFPDGNIYKSQTYMPGNTPQDLILVSTRTYEGYLQVENPFPMVEILPTVKSQTRLATSFRVEESGLVHSYKLSYQFRPDGLPEKRMSAGSQDSQTVVYHYY